MENKIIETTERLQEAHGLIAKYVEMQSLSFEEKKRLLEIYRSIKDTNAIIEYAEIAAHDSMEQLYADAKGLLQVAQQIADLFETSSAAIATFDTKNDCELYLKQFVDARKKAEEEAQKVWEEYKPLNNRLDQWGFSHGYDDEEGFRTLEKECNAVKERYDILHAEAYRLSGVWRKEVSKVSGLMYFDISLLNILSVRLATIAKSIISDIEGLKKQGSV